METQFAYMRYSVWFSIRFRSDSDQCWNIPGWQTCYSVITSNIFFQNNYMQSQKRQMCVGSELKYCNLILQKICFLLCLEIYRVAIDSPDTIRNGWRANSEWLEFITWAVMKHCFYIEKEKRRGLRKVFHSHFITNLITLWREVVLRVDC